MSTDTSRFRLAVLGIVVTSLFSALGARLWYLQVLDANTFVAAAQSNQVRLVYDDAPRGRILDRNGKVLVDNRRSQAITVNRAELAKLPNADEVKARLAALLGISREALDERIADVRYSQYKPVPVAEDVSEELYTYVKEHREELPSVDATIVSERVYPNGPLAAHILGYVGEINDRELRDLRGEGYRLGDDIGKSGVERVYERDLRGEPGVTKYQVDSTGKVLGVLPPVEQPVPGSDVQLTIDLDVQRLAEESLARGIDAARASHDREKKPFKAPGGSVVVLDPRDGAVLAMASYPTYNPNEFTNGIKPSVYAALTAEDSNYPLTNRAIQGLYAPGSTFKLVTAVAAMREGMISGRTTIVDRGVYRVPNCSGEKCQFQNAGRQSYGRVDLPRALIVSSDVYFYGLGARFWLQRDQFGDAIQETARDFGFGRETGIPFATDKAGVVPDPERRKRLHEQYPDKFPEGRWYTGDNINMSIGQGEVAVTPLQLANAYATFGNGGTLFRPRIAAAVLDRDGRVAREETPRAVRNIALAPAMRDPILHGLRGAVARDEGTASGAFAGFDAFPVAGKTGTAEVRGKQDTAIFAAFAPSDHPRYAVAVVLEESGFGGAAAAPVARRILQGIAGQPVGPVQIQAAVD